MKATIRMEPFRRPRAFSAPRRRVRFRRHCTYTWKQCLPASVTFEMAILLSSPSLRVNVALLRTTSSPGFKRQRESALAIIAGLRQFFLTLSTSLSLFLSYSISDAAAARRNN